MIDNVIEEFKDITSYKRSSDTHVAVFGSARIEKGSPFYTSTVELAYTLAKNGCQLVSGGGPGIMLAVSEGAVKAKKLSIGLNISLPFEPPDYSLQGKSFIFKNFFTRKFAFARYSDAFVCMPGGMGTLDELFEIMTLMQTGMLVKKPVILFGSDFWNPLIYWLKDVLRRHKTIGEDDLEALFVTDDCQEAVAYIMKATAN